VRGARNTEQPGGYAGRILVVDLTRAMYEVWEIPPSIARKYVGGTALAVAIHWRLGSADVPPLSGDNPLVFTTGPLVGTKALASGRFAASARSPLTLIWGEADSGGSWGVKLKAAGYDGLVVLGCASRPVYLWVTGERVVLRAASHLWGKDTFHTYELIRSETAPTAAVACIGQAGENLVSFASIMSEGRHARALGRCGLGAVMGFKKLKAVAVSGSVSPSVNDVHALERSVRAVAREVVEKTGRQRRYGTAGGVVPNHYIGDMPARNWTLGDWMTGVEKLSGECMARDFLTGSFYCPACIIGCGRIVRLTRGPWAGTEVAGPEYETIAAFGSLCLNDDLAAVIEANDWCNRYGMDTISTGSVIAFAIEAREQGLLALPVGEPNLGWGNYEAVLEMIHRIAMRQGLGDLLSLGVRAVAQRLGSGALRLAMHVKGLELPFHDPRALSSLAVAYAAHPRGACHRGCSQNAERFPNPEIGLPDVLDRFATDGKGRATALMQNLAEIYNCLKVCHFLMPAVSPSRLLEWVNAVTGWDMDLAELLRVGERSVNLKRLYNLRCGVTRRDDALPARLTSEPLHEGGAAGYVPDLERMLEEYYRFRCWDAQGVPQRRKLHELGLPPEAWEGDFPVLTRGGIEVE